MTPDEKTAVIVDFYKTVESAQRAVEAHLDEWLRGSGPVEFDRFLLKTAALAIELLMISHESSP